MEQVQVVFNRVQSRVPADAPGGGPSTAPAINAAPALGSQSPPGQQASLAKPLEINHESELSPPQGTQNPKRFRHDGFGVKRPISAPIQGEDFLDLRETLG